MAPTVRHQKIHPTAGSDLLQGSAQVVEVEMILLMNHLMMMEEKTVTTTTVLRMIDSIHSRET